MYLISECPPCECFQISTDGAWIPFLILGAVLGLVVVRILIAFLDPDNY